MMRESLDKLADTWVCNPELSKAVTSMNESFRWSTDQIEDLMMVSYRTTKFMLYSAGPLPLGSYGSSLCKQHTVHRDRLDLASRLMSTVSRDLMDVRVPSPAPISSPAPSVYSIVESETEEYFPIDADYNPTSPVYIPRI